MLSFERKKLIVFFFGRFSWRPFGRSDCEFRRSYFFFIFDDNRLDPGRSIGIGVVDLSGRGRPGFPIIVLPFGFSLACVWDSFHIPNIDSDVTQLLYHFVDLGCVPGCLSLLLVGF